MTKFTIPAILERLSMCLRQVLYFGFIVRMGTEVYATIARILTIFAYSVSGGFAKATSTLIYGLDYFFGIGKVET